MKFFLYLLGLLALALGMAACSKALSGPNFVFKKAPAPEVAAKINGQTITTAELVQGIETDLFEAENRVYEIKLNKLRQIVLEKLIAADPRKAGLSDNEFLEKYVTKAKRPTKKEVDEFIKERQIPQENVTDEFRGKVEQFLMVEKRRQSIEDWMGKQTEKNPVEVYLPVPQRPIFKVEVAGSPVMGRIDAKVTIIEFTDLQCPFCAKAHRTIEKILKKYSSQVRLVWKNFPLPFHQDARLAALAARCAYDQGPTNMGKMVSAIFADQNSITMDNLLAMAKKQGLKTEDLKNCIATNKYNEEIDRDILQGQSLGINSTPTFFINGRLINGARPLEDFTQLIDEVLKN